MGKGSRGQGSVKESTVSALVIGPFPPLVGGVSNFIGHTVSSLSREQGVRVVTRGVGTAPSVPSVIALILEEGRVLRYVTTPGLRGMDIVHIHSSSYWSFFRSAQYLLQSRLLSGGRIMLHIHSGEFGEFFTRLPTPIRGWGRWVIERADIIIVTSPRWVSTIRGISGTVPVETVSNGFDPTVFSPMDRGEARKALGVPVGRRMLVSVGRLEAVKGYSHLLDALDELAASRDDVIAYIIGDGSLKEELKSRIKELGLEGWVHLVDNQPHERIPLWIGACDLFVLPSLYEGNPTVMFECLGCGRPFIGTRVGGVPDVIVSEEYGLLCEPGDHHALALRIEEGLGRSWDPSVISSYSKKYTWSNISMKLLEIMQRLASTPRH